MVTTMSNEKRWRNQQIADDIRGKIGSGEYPPGAQLPAIEDLSTAYGVGINTIRNALDRLKNQGLIVGKRGSGTFVRDVPPMRRHGSFRYARSYWLKGVAILEAEAASQGHTATQGIRELAEVPAPDVVAERLNLEPGTIVWARRRTTRVDDKANQLADSFYPLDIAAAAPLIREENTGPGGGFARLYEAGHEPTWGEEEIGVRLSPTDEEAELLELPPGMPVIDLVRTIYDQNDLPVEVMLAVMHPEMVAFKYRFDIPD